MSRTQIGGTLIPQVERRFAQILAQWVWNLRLELGQTLFLSELRTTEFAPALEGEPASTIEPARPETPPPVVIYGPAQWARPSFTGGFPGSAFTSQPDGTLPCPANHPLYPKARRPEHDGSLRIVYAGRIGHCRSCSLRAQCQESSTTLKPRRVSAVVWPLSPSSLEVSPTRINATDAPEPLALAPVLWRDWPRCRIRRAWLSRIRSETVCLESLAQTPPPPVASTGEGVCSRAQRAHWRLSWEQRLARNARPSDASRLVVTLHGLPAPFAHAFGFDLLATA